MARRVNIRFLIILTVVVGICGSAAFVAPIISRRLNKADPKVLLAQANEAITAKDWTKADNLMRRVVQVSPRDPEMWVLWGTVLEHVSGISGNEVEYIQRSRAAYGKAVEADPRYVPAWRHLLTSYETDLDRSPDTNGFKLAADAAGKILSVDPKDKDANRAKGSAIVKPMFMGVATDDARLQEATKALKTAIELDPAEASAPLLLASVDLNKALDLLNKGRRDEATPLVQSAVATMESSLKGQEKNADMNFSAFQIYGRASGLDDDKDRAKKYADKSKECLTAAHDLAAPVNKGFVNIQMYWANTLLQNRDNKGAETVLRDTIAKAPYASEPRLLLATRILGPDPARREETYKLLAEPLPIKPDGNGFDSIVVKNHESAALLTATELRLTDLTTEKDEAAKAKIKTTIESALTTLSDRQGDSWPVLKLKGRYQLEQGQAVQAVQTLAKAAGIVGQATGELSDVNRSYKADLLLQLGRAYEAVGNTGDAKRTYAEVIDLVPAFVPARLMLARLYVGAGDQADDAIEQLNEIDKRSPGMIDSKRLRLAALVQLGKKDEARQLYTSLPATNKMEQIGKAQSALQLDDRDEAIRVLEAANAAAPADVDLIRMLTGQYLASKQTEKAKALVETALKQSPDDQTLKTLKSALFSSTTAEAVDQATQMANEMTDPFARELRLADISRAQGKLDDAMSHLTAAEKLKPGDPKVADGMFQLYVVQKRFDDADKVLPALVKANQDQAGGLVYRFKLAMARENYTDAQTYASELVNKLPEFALSWLSYGQALLATGKYDDAIDKFKRCLDRQSNNLDAFKGLIEAYYRTGKTDEAESAITQARKIFPNDPTVREVALNHTLTYGNPQEVIPAREAALKADEERPANWTALAVAYLKSAQFNAVRVDGQQATKDFLGKAKDLLAKAIAKWPDDKSFVGMYVDSSLALKDTASAEAAMKALAARPAWADKPDAQLMLAEVYARSGNLAAAESAYRVALYQSKDAPEMRRRLAVFLAAQGKVKEALPLLPINDPDITIIRQRFDVLAGASMFKEAEETARAALARDPNSLEMQALLGSTYLDQRRYDDALAQAASVLEKDPNNAVALYVRGLTKMRQSPPAPYDAISDLTAVTKVNPQHVEVRLALAEAYRMSNNVDGAIKVIREGLLFAKDNKPLRLRLLDLYVANDRKGDAESLMREAALMSQLQSDPEWIAAEARAWAVRGDYKRADSRLQDALKLAPGNLNLISARLDVLLKAREYKQVVAEADKVLASNNVWWAHQFKALAKQAMNDNTGAMADMNAAIKSAEDAKSDDAVAAVINTLANQFGSDAALTQLKPRVGQNVRWRLQEAGIYAMQKDYNRAADALDLVMADFDKMKGPEQLQVLRFAGTFYLSKAPAEPEKARDVYLKLLEKSPDDLAALNNIAVILAEQVVPPDPNRALIYSGKAYQNLSNVGRFDPLVYDTHGWVLVLSGKVNDGVQILADVVNRAPFLDAYYHLGEAYLKQNPPFAAEAARQLEQAASAYERDKAAGKEVDPAMKARIDNALSRSKVLIESKSAPAAGAN